MGANNVRLSVAKHNKFDEFYTRRVDIQDELVHYSDHFRGKVIYCNCDHYSKSNFVDYFADNFHGLGLKHLYATNYGAVDLFEDCDSPVCFSYDGNSSDVTYLSGSGDYRSSECLDILRRSDIVVTNPPFSLYRRYVSTLFDYGVDFILIGPLFSCAYRIIFPKIVSGYVVSGVNTGRNLLFHVPEDYEKHILDNNMSHKYIDDVLYASFGTCTWFSTLDHGVSKDFLCNEGMDISSYGRCDHDGDIINVNRVKDIPTDYDGLMAVPISFITKWNRDQFDLLDNMNDVTVNGVAMYRRFLIQAR